MTTVLAVALLVLQALFVESKAAGGGLSIFSDQQGEQQQYCKLLATQQAGLCDGCTSVSLPDSVSSTPELFNITVFAEGDIVSDALKQYHTWDKRGIEEMSRAISEAPGGWVVDVGSQLGWFAFSAAAQGVPVLAIEPLMENLRRLRRSHCHNPSLTGNITIAAFAVGAPGTHDCIMYVDNYNRGDGIIDCRSDFQLPAGHSIQEQPITFRQLDDILQPIQSISYMKIDVEGFEYACALGGRQTFFTRKVPFIMLEYFVPLLAIQMAPHHPQMLLQMFLDAGYDLSLHGFHAQTLTPDQVHTGAGSLATNVYLTHAEALRQMSSPSSA